VKDLLFLSHRIPYPPDKGEKIRAWHMFLRLARTHRVHLGCFIDDPADWAHVAALREHCADLLCRPINPRLRRLRALVRLSPGRPLSLDYFADAGLQAWVTAKLAGGIDRAFVYCSAMAPYVMDAPNLRRVPGLQRVIDMVDVDSAKWADYAARTRGPARLVWAREARTLLAFERKAAASFDHTLFVSEAEAACFRALAPDCAERVGWMDNGVDLDHFAPDGSRPSPFAPTSAASEPEARQLVFTGTMNYRPNVDAMVWFVQEVMPLLRAGPDTVRLSIVGANPSPAVQRLAGPDVTVTGRVADVRPYVVHADAVVAPLRIARGIQNKVLEAMAMGRPVIASPQAFDGVRAVAGRDLLVADGAAAMAACITAVLAGRHPDLPAAARRAMESGYPWEATLAGLGSLFEDTPAPAAVPACMERIA
jgi:polysaccharide biosynthesis protein PslH